MKKILFIFLLIISNIYSQEIYLKNIKYPNTVYTNQIFKITIEATIVVDDYKFIKTNFTNSQNIALLNENSPWELINTNIIKNTYIFKAQNEQFILPLIQINLHDSDENIKYSYEIKIPDIKFNSIATKDKLFSKIIASSLSIEHQDTKQYNNKFLITTLKIDATNSNLEDFNLSFVKEQGLKQFDTTDELKSIYYYLILPRDQKILKFKYYNIENKEFQTISTNIVIKDELISTQTDLNPKKSQLLLYQKILFLSIFLIFILFYFIFKHKLNLFIAIISLFILIILFLPNKTITIDKNTRIYILPLKNSTIFKITSKQMKVEILKSNNGFTKILLPNEQIGWIKL